MKRKTGVYQSIGTVNYFIPDSLPPKNPPFDFASDLADLYGTTMQQLGRLNEMAQRLPDIQRFIKAYVIKEAMLSSAIEGIHTTLIDVFTQPIIGNQRSKETQLVLSYTEALEGAIAIMHKKGLPISSRIILEMHKLLMETGGNHANPGMYRAQSVRVGNLVPPPAQKIPDLMAVLEQYIHSNDFLPPLIRIGLVHVQFETIHPFLDGNGRIGRMLIVLMLIEAGLLETPILYPSYYFKKYHSEYYANLDTVRTKGDFEGWIRYYLKAIEESCLDAYMRAKDIEKLEQILMHEITQEPVRVALKVLFQLPVISVSQLAERIEKSYNSAHKIINFFVSEEILVEETQQKRNKMYRFDAYLQLLEKEY